MLEYKNIKSVTKNQDGTFEVTFNTSSNNYTFFTTPWENVPRYGQDGKLLTPEEFKRNEIEKFGIVYFNQNYANEFVGSSYTLINADTLKKLSNKQYLEKLDTYLKIYEYPKEKHKYIVACDTAKDGTDKFSVQIIDITEFPFIQVASANMLVDYLKMPFYINSWCKYYNSAFLIIENNEGSGQSVADQIYQNYEYENMYFDTDQVKHKKKKYPGFRTTARTRDLILKTMKTFLENDRLILNDETTINQLFSFILIKDKYQADEGCKDDLVMSLALVFAPFCNIKNFEDMKTIINAIYSDSNTENDADFGDMLTISNFDDFTDEFVEKPDKVEYYGQVFEV